MQKQIAWNAIVTAVVFVPLITTFITTLNYYPSPAWSLFSEAGKLDDGRTYFVLLAKTKGGEWEELPPRSISQVLYARWHTLTNYTYLNEPFRISSPHPKNVKLMTEGGGLENVPTGARIPDLLRAWGKMANAKFGDKFTAIKLEVRRWKGGSYDNYDEFQQQWEVEL